MNKRLTTLITCVSIALTGCQAVPQSATPVFPAGAIVDMSYAYNADTVYWPTATANIKAAENNQGFIGEGSLNQEIDWEFDLNSGQLISLQTKEKASGINTLPQGDLAIKQTTIYQLKTTK